MQPAFFIEKTEQAGKRLHTTHEFRCLMIGRSSRPIIRTAGKCRPYAATLRQSFNQVLCALNNQQPKSNIFSRVRSAADRRIVIHHTISSSISMRASRIIVREFIRLIRLPAHSVSRICGFRYCTSTIASSIDLAIHLAKDRHSILVVSPSAESGTVTAPRRRGGPPLFTEAARSALPYQEAIREFLRPTCEVRNVE